jgi:hypothetical protein
LKDIQKLVNEDNSMQNLTKLQEQEYINNLQVHWDATKMGVWTLNKAAALDCQGLVDKMLNEVCTVMSSWTALMLL